MKPLRGAYLPSINLRSRSDTQTHLNSWIKAFSVEDSPGDFQFAFKTMQFRVCVEDIVDNRQDKKSSYDVIGFVEVVVDHYWVFVRGVGGPTFVITSNRRKKVKEKINKNGWDAASELQLKNRLEKKIKEIEREKK